MQLTDLWHASPAFLDLEKTLGTPPGRAHVVGLSGSARRYLLAALVAARGGSALLVAHHAGAAQRLADDLETLLPSRPVAVWPANPYLPYEVIAKSPEVSIQRLAVVRRLLAGEDLIVVATTESLLGRLLPVDVLRAAYRRLAVGERVDLAEWLFHLARLGYERADRVAAQGQFALRGGILDVWDPTSPQPVRIELFDDEVESIRDVEVASQRSHGGRPEVVVGPAREMFADAEAQRRGTAALRREYGAALSRLRYSGREEAARRLEETVGADLDRLEAGADPSLAERYAPLFYPRPGHLLAYFARPPLVAIDEPLRVRETAAALEKEAAERAAVLLEQGEMVPGQAHVYVPLATVDTESQRGPRLALSALLARGQGDLGPVFSFPSKPGEIYHGRWDDFVQALEHHRQQGRRMVVAAATVERAHRLAEAIRHRDLPVRLMPKADEAAPAAREVVVLHGPLEGGFSLPDLGLVVFTDAEIQGRKRRRGRSPSAPGTAIRLGELAVGDVVVHVHHGIGRYVGMKPMKIDGRDREYLEIEYAGGDRVFVPTDQISLVQKYIGPEGKEPRLSRLGGGDWHRTKARVRESVRDMAQELIRLYAAREALPGHAFSPDQPWQRELEDSFPYEETPDQLRAIAEIKADMERPRPMDRLLCGDVGFGKTEVAIRAAFKAVADDKQVAVLVPTTILAQQHYRTFEERLRGLPVKVDLLSRFRTPKEQASVLRRLAEGSVDIVIGTHRLLAKDVRFRDLGLLIVDEEQRFGVAQKERIKALATGVDCLTLTATPIPRTLQFSLFGLRDISLIETPPEDRFPVQTYVVEMSDELVVEAVRREIGRGGQVFYVHNRIESMDGTLARLRRLLPEVRIAVAHGRMREEDLERTMIDFLEGEYDLLLATSIIESGLDMPRVNTLIVENADHLGLAQLYQLRGRVGRSNRLAYAYFTYQRDRALSEVAEKRLSAIQQFTDFGAGFQIAMRDLEIRGAGNILGSEQHGFIVSVGFDMYRQLLEEAIEELRGESRSRAPEPAQVEIALDAYIPATYMPDSRDKMDMYRRIAAAHDPRSVDELEEECQDRFGPPPPPVRNLLAVARIRCLAEEAGVRYVREEDERTVFGLAGVTAVNGAGLAALAEEMRGRVRLVASGNEVVLTLRHPGQKAEEALESLVEVLRRLSTAGPARAAAQRPVERMVP
ncbi:MAG: transcription-repair coupling factor [Firmicutes bacterium]|nr:transcription-repair coupling factor [Bacillota bacterium]